MKKILSISMLLSLLATPALAENHDLSVLQTGDYNQLQITQIGQPNNGASIIDVIQDSAYIGEWLDVASLDGNNINLLLTETGAPNQLSLAQFGSNTANIIMNGADNNVQMQQYGINNLNLAIEGSENQVMTEQFGGTSDNPNSINAQILGYNNLLQISQTGVGHIAQTLQNGTNNSILLGQTGTQQSAYIRQVGSHNAASVIQGSR